MIETIQLANQATIGPYSSAVVVGDMVYVSGQIPRDCRSGKIINDSIELATACALGNMSDVLAAAGCSLADVVKTTVFMRDLADFDGMNVIYAAIFDEHRPARSTVQVAKLPANARIEIDCIAWRKIAKK